ncbi:MAG: SNF2 helicase associated domain-containing protein [Chitinophagaceae bacterium]|nr:SNF2 helicase associated domain-containing protein [Chitinophagaceae bacterium]
MAISHIVKYIYNNSSDEVIRRGKRIFLTQGVKLVKKDELTNQLLFRVRNDQYYNQYNVTISKYHDEKNISARCQCPYNMGEICRHEAAALFFLNELIVNQALDNTQAHFNQSHTVIRMLSIDLKSLRLFTSNALFEEAEKISILAKAKIDKAANEKVEATLKLDDEKFSLILKRNDDKTFDTSCNCSETRHPLCKHKIVLFLQLLNNHGPQYFDSIRNWDNQKNKLLSLYGYSLTDDLKGKFEFYYQDEKPFLKVLDPTIKKVSAIVKPEPVEVVVQAATEKSDVKKRLGVVVNMQEEDYPFFSIDLIEGELQPEGNAFAGNISKVDISKFIEPENYITGDRELLPIIRKLQKVEINRFIAKNSPFGDIWENIVHTNTEWTQESKDLLYEYLQPKLSRLFSSMGTRSPIYVLPKGKPYKTASLYKIDEVHMAVSTAFRVEKTKAHIALNIHFNIDDTEYNVSKNELGNSILFLIEKKLFLLQKAQNASILASLHNMQTIAHENWSSVLQEKIIPLSKSFDVKFGKGLVEYKDTFVPKPSIYLSEQGSYFILKPMFEYDNARVEWNQELSLYSNQDGKVVIIKRNTDYETDFVNMIQSLHTNLKKPEYETHFAIHSKHALQKNWFFLFFDKMKEEKIELLGYESLKNFKIHKSKPSTKVFISSNLDWFDTEVEIDYEGQKASLQDIQSALSKKLNYVSLGDGTFGLLPEEWLAKFSLLFKMAETDGNKLKVSKYNFSVIDELHDMIDDEDIKNELNEKKENLLAQHPENFQQVPIPEELNAELRPYQVAGFQWLTYLDKIKWGGLLADDMGLGKTIQTLTFLQYFKNTNGHLSALVVCPTTLLFNWENEINKFTPDLTYLIHHGPNRTATLESMSKYNIIISTYGTLRSDILMLQKMALDYVVLDESQTIKNPTSKVAKAAQLLNTQNRIALSGTPMQNNTFDIYSQMNFLNPGMLGSKDFFKEQFAKPVDKFQDVESKQHLRKLIYPFLLRRTKEQVAQDLPDKTEVTLYCEMGKEQRTIYDMYKNMYRAQILGTIENQGIEKSQFAILQGLMKLRQICDSPAILKDETKYENHSAKLDELVREMEENIGDHKVLIFSQFLGMLALIREKLTKSEIRYQYFDGSYTAVQRETAIRDFQDNPECRAFLISLKAGGMGLNLTAADYVYIVDPWWNPAVEQQAIDRTHRIGQTKNIFAYRLICKDTVEEKIMILKDKKNTLVKDIVSDDTQMIKQLTKEDVNYLFS